MRLVIALLLLPAVVMAGGCGTPAMHDTPVEPPPGAVFSQYKAPLTVDVDQTDIQSKSGSASTRYLLVPFFGALSFAWERCDIEQAAKNGGLTTVHHADYELLNVLGIYQEFTVHAYGQ
jgi:hypothetical protein